MAEPTFTREQIEEAAEAMGLAGSVADRLFDSMENLTAGASRAGNAMMSLASGTSSLRSSLTNLTNSEVSDYFSGLSGVLVEAKSHFEAADMSVGSLAFALAGLIGPGREVVNTFSGFRQIGAEAQDATAQMSGMVDKLQSLGVMKGPLKVASDMAQLAQSAHNVETQFLRTMAAGGNLGGTFGELDGSLETVSEKTIEMSRLTSNVGTAVGLTAEQVAPYVAKLQGIPGAMNDMVQVTSEAGDTMHGLEAAMKVARGTHQNYGEVLGQLEKFTIDFGSSNKEALESISRMYSATQAIGLRMQDVSRYVENVGDSFKYFGDNTSSSIDILGRLGPALRESGLGARATTELVGTFTQGIQKMDVAQRAFLSAQTGGRGGLAGGLEIEEMLARGDVSKVAEKIEQALKQQAGGRLITRKEAVAGGEDTARQFEFQRQMLTQGPFGQLASSPEAASRLIDALSEGAFDQVGDIIQGKDEALSSAVKDGTSIAERHANIALDTYNTAVHLANINEQQNAKLGRIVAGTKGLFGDKFATTAVMQEAGGEAVGANLSLKSPVNITGQQEMEDKFGGSMRAALDFLKSKAGIQPEKALSSARFKEDSSLGLTSEIAKMTMAGQTASTANIQEYLEGNERAAAILAKQEQAQARDATPYMTSTPTRNIQQEINTMSQIAASREQQNPRQRGDDDLGTITVKVGTDDKGILRIIDQQIQDNNKKVRFNTHSEAHTGLTK